MNRIILALDNLPTNTAYSIAHNTKGLVWGYKLRRQIYDNGLGIIREFRKQGNVMVDFKLYDIPSAIEEAMLMHVEAGANITTVHCTAKYRPTELAYGKFMAGVTILTSMTDDDFSETYNEDPDDLPLTVRKMAEFANTQQYGYTVCSAKELDVLYAKEAYGDLTPLAIKAITPGIRPLWYQEEDDQDRTMTPGDAVKSGAELLVMSRPILKANISIHEALERTNAEIAEAEAEMKAENEKTN